MNGTGLECERQSIIFYLSPQIQSIDVFNKTGNTNDITLKTALNPVSKSVQFTVSLHIEVKSRNFTDSKMVNVNCIKRKERKALNWLTSRNCLLPIVAICFQSLVTFMSFVRILLKICKQFFKFSHELNSILGNNFTQAF